MNTLTNRHLIAEIQLNFRVLLRQPGFWIPTVIFPAMLYAFFGAQSGNGQWTAQAMASFCIYAVLGVGFFQFGLSIAQDRESAFAKWQSSLPGGAHTEWVARILAAQVFSALSVSLVIVLALVMTDVALDAGEWVSLAAVCFVSSVTAAVMGIALGSWCSARAAVPLANLVYLPLAYLGGLWVPPVAMPSVINAISQWTPTRAMGELGWAAVEDRGWSGDFVLSLIVWTIAAAMIALAAQWRARGHA